MQLTKAARTDRKQHIVVIVVTLLVTIAYWGAGFWALGQPEWGGGLDRGIYVDAARNFFRQENLYVDINQPLPDDLIFYNYSPLAALWVGSLSFLPPAVLYVLHFVAVVALWLLWRAIFQKVNLQIPAWVIPLWFIFSPFLYDAVTLNINVFLALLATLYLFFHFDEQRLSRPAAALSLFLIVTAKPQWGFFALLPLVERDWKKFMQILAGLAVLYLLVLGLGSLLTSPGYILEQHILFAKHLASFTQRFTYWNLPPGPYEYNNSIHQAAIYLLGNVTAGLAIAGYVQLGLFAMLVVLFVRTIRTEPLKDPEEKRIQSLRWFFILYCVTLLYPPLNFDFSLGIPMFLFLAAQGRMQKFLLLIPFLFIALQDTLSMIASFSGISGWFPFIFIVTVISLTLLLAMKPDSVRLRQRIA